MAKGKRPATKKTAAKKKATPAPRKPASKTDAAKAAIGHNAADPKVRELFLQHKEKVDKLRQQAQSAQSKLRAAYKAAKADKFEQYMFDTARQLETPEGEAEFVAKLGKQVQAAQFVGNTLVAQIGQLDLFDMIDRTDSTERAYDEGQKASMGNKQAKPDYAPGTAQHEAYLKGYHDHQAQIAKGFKSTDKGAKPATEAARNAKPPRASQSQPVAEAGPSDEDGPGETSPEPASGERLTRSEFLRRQAAAQISAAPHEPEPPVSQFSRRVQ